MCLKWGEDSSHMSNLESAVSLKGVKECHFHGCLYIEMTMQFNKHLHSAFDGCFHLKHLTVHNVYIFYQYACSLVIKPTTFALVWLLCDVMKIVSWKLHFSSFFGISANLLHLNALTTDKTRSAFRQQIACFILRCAGYLKRHKDFYFCPV